MSTLRGRPPSSSANRIPLQPSGVGSAQGSLDGRGGNNNVMEFKYTKPRVGAQYQVKVPKLGVDGTTLPYDSRIPLRGGSVATTSNCGNIGSGGGGGNFNSTSATVTVTTTVPAPPRRGRPPKNAPKVTTSVVDVPVSAVSTSSSSTTAPPNLAGVSMAPSRGGMCIHRTSHKEATCNRLFESGGVSLKQEAATAAAAVPRQERYLLFGRNLLLQPSQVPPSCASPTAQEFYGDERARFLYGQAFRSSDSSGVSNASKGRKRKLPDDDEEAWGLASKRKETSHGDISLGKQFLIKDATDGDSSPDEAFDLNAPSLETQVSNPDASLCAAADATLFLIGSEHDEPMLEYLHRRQGGDCDAAMVSLLADLSRGKAVNSLRHAAKKRKAVVSSSVSAWKERYRRLTTVMLGDLRSSGMSTVLYSYHTDDTQRSGPLSNVWMLNASSGQLAQTNRDEDANQQALTTPDNTTSSTVESLATSTAMDCDDEGGCGDAKFVNRNEEYKDMWKSILDIAVDLLRRMCDSRSSIAGRPSLRTVCVLLDKALGLPDPDAVFGRRGAFVKSLGERLNAVLDYIEDARRRLARLYDLLHDDDRETIARGKHGSWQLQYQPQKQSGIEIEAMRQALDDTEKTSPIRIEEVDVFRIMLKQVEKWERRVERLGSASLVRESDEEAVTCTEPTVLGNVECCKEEAPNDLSVNSNSLATAETLLNEAADLPFRPRTFITLSERVKKARVLRDRVLEWNKGQLPADKVDSVKFVSAMVKEANRFDLTFPELTILRRLHRTAEEWIDRASVAIRSRISLTELEELLEKGDSLPINLSEWGDKLRNRSSQAQDWIGRFKMEVPCPQGSSNGSARIGMRSDAPLDTRLELLKRIRRVLSDEDKSSALVGLASDATKIPVDIDFVTLLQIELDARSWALKARRLLPTFNRLALATASMSTSPKNGEGAGTDGSASHSRRSKIEDVRDHLSNGASIRRRVQIITQKGGEEDEEWENFSWELEHESDLRRVDSAANAWFEKYRTYLEGDNRRPDGRCCLSVITLRRIVSEGNAVGANLGNWSIKMKKILDQAEAWYTKYEPLLVRTKIAEPAEGATATSNTSPVSLSELTAAVNAAASEVPVDLDEAKQLQTLTEKAQSWFDRATLAAPTRSKRTTKGRKKTAATGSAVTKEKHTEDQLRTLIEEGASLPFENTEKFLDRLRVQLSELHSWRMQAQCDLRKITESIESLRLQRIACFGLPEEFQGASEAVASLTALTSKTEHSVVSEAGTEDAAAIEDASMDLETETETPAMTSSRPQGRRGVGQSKTSSVASVVSRNGAGDLVFQPIKALLDGARTLGVHTAEEDVARDLDVILRWCKRCFAACYTPDKMLVKENFKELDRLIEEGTGLLGGKDSFATGDHEAATVDETLMEDVKKNWTALVQDDMTRLERLRTKRTEFIAWCEEIDEMLKSSEKKITLESLREIVSKSSVYPASVDAVKHLRKRAEEAEAWVAKVQHLQNSDQKLSLEEAKVWVSKGDSLNIATAEGKILRAAIKTARNWAGRVKRSGLESGQAHISVIQELMAEHEAFIVSMPEEVAQLKQALCGYCLCRRPYDGFMIGCDECEEWYHGPCVGISEEQAEQVDKWVCVRCCIVRTYQASASAVAGVVRKWSDTKDLTKARSHEANKHQRRIRKAERDIEKLEKDLSKLPRSKGVTVAPSRMGDSDVEAKCSASDVVARELQATEDFASGDLVDGMAAGFADLDPNRESLDASMNGLPVAGGTEGKTRGSSPETIHSSDESRPAPGVSEEDNADSKLRKLTSALESTNERMRNLHELVRTRKAMELVENARMDKLKTWSHLIMRTVLAPSTQEQADVSRPTRQGETSEAMRASIDAARRLGLKDLPDIKTVSQSYNSIAWCLRALQLLRRKPDASELESLVTASKELRLPEDKAVRFLRSLHQRASTWRLKVTKTLAPVRGDTKPYDMAALKELAAMAKDIPVIQPEESRLWNTIEDRGKRHCICGGPGDGSFMLSCDRCNRWFHGKCMDVDKERGDAIESWVCPPCQAGEVPTTTADEQKDGADEDTTQLTRQDHFPNEPSPHAKDPFELWPPFGLLGTSEAEEALGPATKIDVDITLPPESLDSNHEDGDNGAPELQVEPNGEHHDKVPAASHDQSQCDVPSVFPAASELQGESDVVARDLLALADGPKVGSVGNITGSECVRMEEMDTSFGSNSCSAATATVGAVALSTPVESLPTDEGMLTVISQPVEMVSQSAHLTAHSESSVSPLSRSADVVSAPRSQEGGGQALISVVTPQEAE